MSNKIFNDEVTASFGFPFYTTTRFNNTDVRSAAGTRQVFQNSDHDRKIYNVNYMNLLESEKNSFLRFFEDHYGSAQTFLLKDARHYSVVSENIGTGDGSTLTFQLTDNGFKRWNIKSGTLTVWVAGVEQNLTSDYTITLIDDGRVIFNSGTIPGVGEAVVASYEFYRRVHFVTDDYSNAETEYHVNQIADIQMREVQINPS